MQRIQVCQMIYRAALNVLVWDESVKYCMQSTLAMGRASKTSAFEQMEQNDKSLLITVSLTQL